MQFIFKNIIIILSIFLITGCSSITNLDVSSIIDKTEKWLFDEDKNDEAKSDIKIAENQEIEVEEVFPEINDIPQSAPEFEEINENFFFQIVGQPCGISNFGAFFKPTIILFSQL